MLRPIAVTVYKNSIVILYCENGNILKISTNEGSKEIRLENQKSRPEKIELCKDFRLSKKDNLFVLCYTRNNNIQVEAHSKDLKKFIIISEKKDHFPEVYTHWHKKNIAYYENYHIFSNISDGILLSPRTGFFDYAPLYIIGIHNLVSGILVVYGSKTKNINVGAALFSQKDPHKIIWRSEAPLFEKDYDRENLWETFGTVFSDGQILLYIGNKNGNIISVPLPHVLRSTKKQNSLERAPHNPVIKPNEENHWEAEAVFNPGALYDNNEVHLLYRAIGRDGLSTIGYAKSPDGFFFERASDQPIFTLGKGQGYQKFFFPSGGSSGGSEDPRAVKIGKRIYVTYVYFGGWDSLRMALTSISVEDFRKQNWNWAKPIFLSPPNEVHKNWVLFPEKINGKFAILHSITPTVLIDYVDDLKNVKIKSRTGPAKGGRKNFWDNKVRGAGPPPIKTKVGWLLLYHATDAYDPQRYKMGAMILDLKDPTKILYRSSTPLLCPDMVYENDGKPGVVYASGAIVKEDRLFIYYGGADKVVCLATAPLSSVIDDLINHHEINLETKANLKI